MRSRTEPTVDTWDPRIAHKNQRCKYHQTPGPGLFHAASPPYLMMESSAKTSSSDHSAFISAAHLVPDFTACRWIGPHQLAAGINNEDEEESVDERRGNAEVEEIPKVPLFEKPLTPSDVGKLNRLVIPKQHAEKYFPLNGGADSGESGMLLNFEDEAGKLWRFRYSYWSSSQSYVLTKGWSRFVKEKKLDAGDAVVFTRHLAEPGRFFIGWRRRDAQDGANVTNGSGWSRALYSKNPNRNQGPSSLPHPPDCNRQGVGGGSSLQSQTQTTSACGNSKRLRLFGVNLECLADDSDSATPVQHQYFFDHMETTFPGAEDGYRQG